MGTSVVPTGSACRLFLLVILLEAEEDQSWWDCETERESLWLLKFPWPWLEFSMIAPLIHVSFGGVKYFI